MKIFIRLILLAFVALFLYDCARKGRPSGGPKDETAPIMVTANPPNETTNFKAKKIKIYFDEYIVLKDLNKELIVSPPLKNPPLITPQGTPSKYITIEILDTLKPNTTYTFSFGNSVQDNNENNKLEAFKYVFSTGSYIDSLTMRGNVKDAFNKETVKNVSVLLYKMDSSYIDSIIYKEKPFYVTSTIDSSSYNFSNLQKGKYLLVALKEDAKNYIFNSKEDKIAFTTDTISIPRDSVYTTDLKLFKEIQPYKFKRGKAVKKGKIEFGFEGEKQGMSVQLLSDVPENFKSFSKFEKDKDTLNYWFTPFEADSLNFIVSNIGIKDTATIFLRKKKIDSLSVATSTNGLLHITDTLFFNTNNPIVKLDSSLISMVDKDTVDVKFELKQKDVNSYALLFNKKHSMKYTIKVLPKTFTDLYNTFNKDTLKYSIRIPSLDDYGTISVDVKNKKNQYVILELYNQQNVVVRRSYISSSKKIEFKSLPPQKYNIRAIIDANRNNIWDTGNYLTKKQPEKVFYFKKEINLRANWVVSEIFTIK